jgi:hypothetical protein
MADLPKRVLLTQFTKVLIITVLTSLMLMLVHKVASAIMMFQYVAKTTPTSKKEYESLATTILRSISNEMHHLENNALIHIKNLNMKKQYQAAVAERTARAKADNSTDNSSSQADGSVEATSRNLGSEPVNRNTTTQSNSTATNPALNQTSPSPNTSKTSASEQEKSSSVTADSSATATPTVGIGGDYFCTSDNYTICQIDSNFVYWFGPSSSLFLKRMSIPSQGVVPNYYVIYDNNLKLVTDKQMIIEQFYLNDIIAANNLSYYLSANTFDKTLDGFATLYSTINVDLIYDPLATNELRPLYYVVFSFPTLTETDQTLFGSDLFFVQKSAFEVGGTSLNVSVAISDASCLTRTHGLVLRPGLGFSKVHFRGQKYHDASQKWPL